LPKMRRTPSAMSCSIIARLPVILGMVGLQSHWNSRTIARLDLLHRFVQLSAAVVLTGEGV